MNVGYFRLFLLVPLLHVGCARTEIVESPRTGYGTVSGKEPDVLWSSRVLRREFDYLGQVKVRSWSYGGAVERLTEGAKSLGADAIVDIHYEVVGFLDTLHGFAVKYK